MLSKKLELFGRLQSFSQPGSRIRALNVHLPERIVDNETLVGTLDIQTPLRHHLPKLFERLTGIKTRHYAPKGTAPSDLAFLAVQGLLEQEGISPHSIDTLIFASTDHDLMEPATANLLQEKLGLERANSFDIKNACNSILQAIHVANSLILSGSSERVLIASGEMGSYACSRVIRDTEELKVKMGGLTLGDAGAAILMEPSTDQRGILEVNLLTLGEHWPLCRVPKNVEWRHHPFEKWDFWFYLDMLGLAKVAKQWTREYFMQYAALRRERWGEERFLASLTYLVPHQISKRFIEEMGKGTGFDMDKVCVTAHRYGNTASTAIPLALRTLMDTGKLSIGSGQEVLLYGAASGFSLGHIRLRL